VSERQATARDDQLRTLLETVERIRAEKYADVPAGLVKQILLRHGDAAATEAELVRDLEKLVDDAMKQEGRDA